MPIYMRGETYWIDFRFQGTRYRRAVANAATDGGKKKAKKAAEDALSRIKGRIASGDFDPAELDADPATAPRETILFEKALDLYLESRKGKGRSMESYKRLDGDWRNLFGARPLASIKGEEIEGALNAWTRERGLAPATRNNALAQLSGFFTWCMKRKTDGRRWIEHHPIREGGVERVAVDNRRERWLRPEEIEALRANAPGWLADIILFACSTGMRLSEVCSLTRASVHKDANGDPFILTERTKNGERLAWPLVGAVRTLVEARLESCRFPAAPLFPGRSGGRATSSILEVLPGVVKAAGLRYGRKHADGVTFHTFRHSMASLAINAGVPASVVQRMGNWKTRAMLDRYAHLADETLRDAAGTVAQLVTRGHNVVTVPEERKADAR